MQNIPRQPRVFHGWRTKATMSAQRARAKGDADFGVSSSRKKILSVLSSSKWRIGKSNLVSNGFVIHNLTLMVDAISKIFSSVAVNMSQQSHKCVVSHSPFLSFRFRGGLFDNGGTTRVAGGFEALLERSTEGCVWAARGNQGKAGNN